MSMSRGQNRPSQHAAPAHKPGLSPHRSSQFVMTSKVINAPQTAFLAQSPNTQEQLRVAKQAQTQDPRVVSRHNKNAPRQVALPRGSDSVTYRGNAVSFGSQNRTQLPTAPAKQLPNASYLALHSRHQPRQAKTQAAAQKLHTLLS